ncbi:ribonuclease H-like domain-containing protein [Tanacetum coccineum]
MDAYFQKIESIVSVLKGLESPIRDEDIVNIALEGLPSKYNHVYGIIVHRESLLDLKTVRSMLTTEEMRLRTPALDSFVDATSSSPVVLLANTEYCKFLHNGVHGLHSLDTKMSLETPTDDMQTLKTFMTKLGFDANILSCAKFIVPTPNNNSLHVAYHTTLQTQPITHGASQLARAFDYPTMAQQAYYPQDPAAGNWNMDASASSHLHDSVSSLSNVFNKCIYPSVSACQHCKHVKLPFVSSSTLVHSCFDIVHSDLWTSPIPSLSRFNPLVTSTHTEPVHSNDSGPTNTNDPGSTHTHATSPIAISLDDPCPPPLRLLSTNRPTQRFTLHVSSISPLPKSYSDAFNDPNWKNVMSDEYNALIKNNTWTLVPRPTDANIVRCMWLFRHKYLADGTLSRYKARLVANGSTRIEGVDVDETCSLMVKPGTIRTVLSLAISRHWPVHQLDVKNDFLHGDLSETVYIHQPPGFQDSAYPNYGIDTAYLLLYVDDIVLTASSKPLLQRIISSLHHELVWLVVTPVDTESKLGDDGDPVSDSTLYRSLSSTLQYLTFTPPDISYAVQQVCLHMHDPRESHFSALKRVLRYVSSTLDYVLQLFSSSTTSLVAYSNADWAGCPTTRRSTSRYCVFLGNNLISWSSKRQPTLSRSSAEAEYRGVANVIAETCWLRNLLRELHTPLSSATLVYCDNVRSLHVPLVISLRIYLLKDCLRLCLRSFVPV